MIVKPVTMRIINTTGVSQANEMDRATARAIIRDMETKHRRTPIEYDLADSKMASKGEDIFLLAVSLLFACIFLGAVCLLVNVLPKMLHFLERFL